MAAAHEKAIQRAPDRVGHQPGLVREEHEQQCGQRQGEQHIRTEGAQVAAHRSARAARHDRRKQGHQCRHRDRRHDECGPEDGRVQGQRPPGDQGKDARRRRQRAPQVVEHFPAADQRQRARAPGDPRQELPVAARPAVLARGGDVVAGGKFLDHLDIGGEAGAREGPLEQIVAEQRPPGTRPSSAASKASTS
jgi:hypothetical protein